MEKFEPKPGINSTGLKLCQSVNEYINADNELNREMIAYFIENNLKYKKLNEIDVNNFNQAQFECKIVADEKYQKSKKELLEDSIDFAKKYINFNLYGLNAKVNATSKTLIITKEYSLVFSDATMYLNSSFNELDSYAKESFVRNLLEYYVKKNINSYLSMFNFEYFTIDFSNVSRLKDKCCFDIQFKVPIENLTSDVFDELNELFKQSWPVFI